MLIVLNVYLALHNSLPEMQIHFSCFTLISFSIVNFLSSPSWFQLIFEMSKKSFSSSTTEGIKKVNPLWLKDRKDKEDCTWCEVKSKKRAEKRFSFGDFALNFNIKESQSSRWSIFKCLLKACSIENFLHQRICRLTAIHTRAIYFRNFIHSGDTSQFCRKREAFNVRLDSIYVMFVWRGEQRVILLLLENV